jgi:hypothetical protein
MEPRERPVAESELSIKALLATCIIRFDGVLFEPRFVALEDIMESGERCNPQPPGWDIYQFS